MNRLLIAYLGFCVFLIGACASFGVNADLGATTLDAEVPELQLEIDAFLTHLEKNLGTDDAAYEHHVQFYVLTRDNIAALESMAAGDRVALKSIRLIGSNLDRLEAAHRAGLAPGELPILRGIFDSQFVSLTRHATARKTKSGGREQ